MQKTPMIFAYLGVVGYLILVGLLLGSNSTEIETSAESVLDSSYVQFGEPTIMNEPIKKRDHSALRIERAISLYCAWKGSSLTRVFQNYSYTALELAEIIRDTASRHKLDPFLLVAMAGRESVFDSTASHDTGRGCGMMGIRTDYEGRPSCEWLLVPANSLEWAAKRLRESATQHGGVIHLRDWNGGQYEVRIWRDVDRLHRSVL
jgi:hypothetical protein